METLPKLMAEEACSYLARIDAIPGRKVGRRWVFSPQVADGYVRCRCENLAPATANQRRLK
jgi:hypothetical protein